MHDTSTTQHGDDILPDLAHNHPGTFSMIDYWLIINESSTIDQTKRKILAELLVCLLQIKVLSLYNDSKNILSTKIMFLNTTSIKIKIV